MRRFDKKRPRSGVEVRCRGLSKAINFAGDVSMKRKLSQRGGSRNMNPLPLLEWADSQRRREPARCMAAREMQRRGAYSPSVAMLMARLAGLPVEED